MDAHQLIDRLDTALEKALGEDEFDLGIDEESGAIELATDEWTLVLEAWPDGIGFLALDDDPAPGSSAELLTAIELLIGPALAPIKDADAATGGGIAAALVRTFDPVSNALASLLQPGNPSE